MIMTTTTKRQSAIHLNYDSGRVVVETQDEDRFVLSAKKAIEACVQSHLRDEAIKTVKGQVLTPLRRWCEAHASRISSCYASSEGKYLQVFVVGATDRFDFDLEGELSKLEIAMFDSGWRMSAQQIPLLDSEDQDTYFNIGEAMEIYAVGKQTRIQGEK